MTHPADWRSWSEPDKARLRWALAARPAQRPPAGAWYIWLIMTGRGWGKTRTGAEWLADNAWRQPDTDWGVFGPTYSDTRDVCVEGRSSGLLACLGRSAVATYNRSLGEIELTNGSRIKMVSADEPDRARGWNFHGAWCDELASWRRPATWYEGLVPAVRMGTPRIVVTTTPKPTPLIRGLYERVGRDVVLTRGRLRDNAENLGAGIVEALEAQYGGTRTGRQEIEGELLEDVEGALWQRSWIEEHRVSEFPRPGIIGRTVVALDPAGGTEEGDEQAIVVACQDLNHRFFVLHSEGTHLSPDAWLRRAERVFEHFRADTLVYEKNYGDKFLTALLGLVAPNLPARPINAGVGKRLRAEPISALYEQGKVSHVGAHDVLEDQLCSFTGAPGEASPDRLDALVYALTELRGAGTLVRARDHDGTPGVMAGILSERAVGF